MPKVVDHDQRRAEIISCSYNIIAEDGFNKLTIRGLAKELGMTAGLVTHYYASKEEIVLEILQEIQSRFFDRVQESIEDAKGVEAIRRRILASLPLSKKIRDDWLVEFQFWGRTSQYPGISKFVSRQKSIMKKMDMRFIEQGQALGEINGDLDLGEVYEQIDALISGLGLKYVFSPSRLKTPVAIKVVDNVLGQLGS